MKSTCDDSNADSESLAFCLAEDPPTEFLETSSRYRLHGFLGSGGMGVVYRATDIDLHREVAIKIMLGKYVDSCRVENQFVNEAHVMGRLQHPGIAQIFDFGSLQDGRPFHAMRLVEGKTYGEILEARSSNTLLSAEVLNIFSKACQAIAYTHDQGFVHLDLKPANIMVGAFGEVHVMDWGLARRVAPREASQSPSASDNSTNDTVGDASDDTLHSFPPVERRVDGKEATAGGSPDLQGSSDSSWGASQHPDLVETECWGAVDLPSPDNGGRMQGTLRYMAPEQARGEWVDRRTDVFCLGAILCEIFTGQPPYIADNKSELVKQASNALLDPAHRRLEGCGGVSSLVRLAIRCLQANPDDRPTDAKELANELAFYGESSLQIIRDDMTRFFELSLDLFCIAGFDGFFRRINSNFSRVLGYSEEELLAQPFLSFVVPEDQEKTVEVMGQLLHGKPVVNFRNRYRTKSGELIEFEWVAKSILSEDRIFAVARQT